jgi:Immunity protein 21
VDLDWLDDGNLLLLLAEPLLGEWHGIGSSDYDRVCAVSDSWLGLIPVGRGAGLVLGGDAGIALCVPSVDGSVAVVRWVHGDNEHELVAFALRAQVVTRTEPDLVFDNIAASWRMFNAAADPLTDGNPTRHLELPVGRVRVETTYREAERNAAIVHRFRRAAEPSATADRGRHAGSS